jgi:energy-converting hydrogenase Eha subunit A
MSAGHRFFNTIQPRSADEYICRYASHMSDARVRRIDLRIYILGVVLGICAGMLDVIVGDLLGTALFVLISTMILGMLRPERPWRWTVTIGIFVPLVRLGAYLLLGQKPYPAEIYESALGFVTGIAGAYGGAVGRRGFHELFGK